MAGATGRGAVKRRKNAAAMLITLAIATIVVPCATAEAAPHTPSGAGGSACVPTVEGPIATTDTSKPYTAVLQYDLPPRWVDKRISSPVPHQRSRTRPPSSFANPRLRAGLGDRRRRSASQRRSLGLEDPPAAILRRERRRTHRGGRGEQRPARGLVERSDPTRYASLSIPTTPDATNEVLAGVGAFLHQRPKALLR